jgi:hypothetical protein
LTEAIKLGKMNVLYYLWDTAHLMVAYSAMVLFEILKHSSRHPDVSVQTVHPILADLAAVHQDASESLLSRDNSFPHPCHKIAPECTIAAQAQLILAILSRVESDFLCPQQQAEASRVPRGLANETPACEPETQLIGLQSLLQSTHLHPQHPVPSNQLHDSVQGGSNSPPSYPMVQLTDETDFSLISSFIDSQYMAQSCYSELTSEAIK